MAVPTFLTPAYTHNTANATSTVVALPDGSNVSGRLVIIGGSKDGAAAFTTPSGWTLIPNTSGGGLTMAGAYWYRIIDGTEGFDGTGDTVTVTHANEETAFFGITFTLWHGTTPPEGNTDSPGEVSSSNPPNLAPSWGSADVMYLASLATDNSLSGIGFPTGYDAFTDHGDNTGGTGGTTHALCGKTATGSSSDDPGTFTWTSATEEAWGTTIAVRGTADAPTSFPFPGDTMKVDEALRDHDPFALGAWL